MTIGLPRRCASAVRLLGRWLVREMNTVTLPTLSSCFSARCIHGSCLRQVSLLTDLDRRVVPLHKQWEVTEVSLFKVELVPVMLSEVRFKH